MDSTLHDMRNDLAVAIASLHAFIDGKRTPTGPHLQTVLDALEGVAARLPAFRPAVAPAIPSDDAHLLDAIIEGSPYAKILVDDNGTIVLVNAQTEALFGYPRDELLGQPIEMLVPQPVRAGHDGLRSDYGRAPTARPMGAGRDLYGRRRDGTDVAIEIGLNPIRTASRTFTLAAVTDITERKHAEQLRLANRDLATASRFKTQFVATMSHELRTPLTAIISAAELLDRSRLDDRATLAVQTISEAAEALVSLIGSVLDFSKIEAGKIELQYLPFDLESVLEGTAEVVAQLARDKGVTVYTYVDPAIPQLQGDADRLRQIALNLLGNAVKFTDRGHVVARAFLTERSESEARVRLEVEDTGIGIQPSLLPVLFEPFTQGSAARGVAGSGLGLSIARTLVALMGGEIGVSSELGTGSSFSCTLRFGIAAHAAAAPKHALDGIAGLIVSGDETFADIVTRYLASWSMETRRIDSRDAVIAALHETAHTWIAIVDLENVGVGDVAVTSDVLRAILPQRIVAVGQDAALRKPIRQSQLYDAIVAAAGVHGHAPVLGAPSAPLRRPLGKVLVAEDNVHLARLLKLQFDELGIPTVFVSDGVQAVAALRSEPFAMVFMDCQMPTMDGLTATRAIRADEGRRGGHVPIAAMTASAFAEDRHACLAAGMDDYLAKPVKLADLRTIVERWSVASVAGS